MKKLIQLLALGLLTASAFATVGCKKAPTPEPEGCEPLACRLDCAFGPLRVEGCDICECAPRPPAADGCVITGCSGQLCEREEMATTCEFRPGYECFGSAACEEQPNGECGWTPNRTFDECIADVQATECGPGTSNPICDCRLGSPCGDGSYCSFCWGTFQCIPEGAVC